MRVSSTRKYWWNAGPSADVADELVRSLGKLRVPDLKKWAYYVVSWRWRWLASAKGKRETREIVKRLGDDPSLIKALESVYRMSGRVAALRFANELGKGPPPPKPTEEEVRARRREGLERMSKAREENARRKLAEHEKRLRRETKLVKKWRAVVKRYEAKRRKP